MCSLIQNQWGINYLGNWQSSFHLVPLFTFYFHLVPLLTFKEPTGIFAGQKKHHKNNRKISLWEETGETGEKALVNTYHTYNICKIFMLKIHGKVAKHTKWKQNNCDFLTTATVSLKLNSDMFL